MTVYPLDGMDWMTAQLSWLTRNTPERANDFTIILNPDGEPDVERLRTHMLERLSPWYGFLRGHLKKGQAYYEPGAEEPPEIRIFREKEAFENAMREPFAGDAKFRIDLLHSEDEPALAFRFSHTLCDGSGAEQLIAGLLGKDKPDWTVPSNPPDRTDAIKAAGQAVGRYQMELLRHSIADIPRGSKQRMEYHTLSIPPEKTEELTAESERAFGPFTFSFLVFGIVLTQVEGLLRELKRRGDFLMIPMSVDLRRKHHGGNGPFFNRWSVLPLLIPRNALDTVPHATEAVRAAWIRGLERDLPEQYHLASKFLRRVPLPVLGLMPQILPKSTAGSLMFSFLPPSILEKTNLPDWIPTIRNLRHFPVMPPVSGLGIFANLFRGNLNLTLAVRSGNLPSGRAQKLRADLESTLWKGLS